ncbi:MAG TPA: porin family protein [Bacteroidia bacterium]|nr:porin family protein [Bacteroidia bacterium]
MKTFFKYLFIALLALTSLTAVAQDPNERGNLPNYYQQKLHFGFALSVNRTNFFIDRVEHFERLDSIRWVNSYPKSGFNLAIVSEITLHKYVTFRFLPTLSFAERSLDFFYVAGKDSIVKTKSIESAFINFPFDFKLRSKRVKNFGAYILAGGGYSLDLSSKRKVDNTGLGVNDQIVKLKRDDFFYEGGAGAEFYLQYFKFAIEAKVSMGTLNMLQKDNTVFANAIDKLKTKVLTISITFEGGI